MVIYINSGRCGSGKTREALRDVATIVSKTIFVVDRVEVIAERVKTIEAAADAVGVIPPVIIPLHAENGTASPYAVPRVRQTIESQAAKLKIHKHAILIITAEAMMAVDWLKFDSSWAMVIDEAPSIFLTESVCTSANIDFFRTNYDLTPLQDSGWSRVSATADYVTLDALNADQNMSTWAPFHRRVSGRRGVFANLADWHEAAPPGRKWSWFSIWCPGELEHLRSVTILAAGFNDTMAAKLMARIWPDITFDDITPVDARVWRRRNVRVRYFVEQHDGSTAFWSEPEGTDALRKVGAWLREQPSEGHIYMCNHGVDRNLGDVPGKQLTPKQHGSNEWADFTCCTMIYSAKSQPDEQKVLSHLEITKDEVRRAREYEDLLQFAFRLSLRNPNDTRAVEIRVYDRRQADFLVEALASTGYLDVDMECITGAGVHDITRPKPGPKEKSLGPAEQAAAIARSRTTDAERKRKKRAEKSEKAKAAGTYRPRGRPKAA